MRNAMRPFFILIVLCSITLSVNAQLNIDTCQQQARANYPMIKQYDLINKSTEYTVSNANKAYLPQISINGIGAYIIKGLPEFTLPGQTPPERDNFQFIGIAQINQTIWDGGATGNQKEITKANAEVEKSSIEVSLQSIRERVNQMFFGILVIDEQLKQLNILNDNLNLNYNRLKLSKDNGLALQTDADELKSEILTLEQRKIEFQYTRSAYVQMLSLLTGVKLNENVKLETPVIIETNSMLSNNRPEIKLYNNQIKLIEAQSNISKVYNMPKIGLIGAGILIEPGLNFATSNLNSLAIAGLSLSWNTGGIYKSSNNKNIDKLKTDRINNQIETFLFNNNLQLTQTSGESEKYKALIAKDDEIILLKNSISRDYQLRYDNGMCSMNDLIQSMNKESEAKGNRALHNVQLLMSQYNYKTINGN